jgi:hypothetical protein
MIAVGGCSFSHSFGIKDKFSYPYLLANKLHTHVVDESRVQGSNFRIWRILTKHIIDGNISPTDTLIIQYTEIHRQEIWSPVAVVHPDPRVEEPYDGGKLFRFKLGSHMYGQGIEKPLSNMLYRCSNEKYELEKFLVMHEMFCALLKHRGFDKVYFLDTIYSPFDKVECKHYLVINGRHLLEHHLPGDTWHLSEEGHRRAADLILDFIQA